jgi:hypothetical protein
MNYEMKTISNYVKEKNEANINPITSDEWEAIIRSKDRRTGHRQPKSTITTGIQSQARKSL